MIIRVNGYWEYLKKFFISTYSPTHLHFWYKKDDLSLISQIHRFSSTPPTCDSRFKLFSALKVLELFYNYTDFR